MLRQRTSSLVSMFTLAVFAVLTVFATFGTPARAQCPEVLSFECQPDCATQTAFLSWNTDGVYGLAIVIRDGVEIGDVPFGVFQFVDSMPPGDHVYQLMLDCMSPSLMPPTCLASCLPLPPDPQFIRGDANGDGGVNIADWIKILEHLFALGSVDCRDALDANDDGSVNISDAIYGLSFQFSGTAPPPAPYPNCGVDPTPDSVDCQSSPCVPDLGPNLMTLARWADDSSAIDAFAVQLYSDAGEPLSLQWINEPFLVQAFVESIYPSSADSGKLTHDLALPVHVSIGGEILTMDLVNVSPGQVGTVMLQDGSLLADPALRDLIAESYGVPEFDSNKEKENESSCGDSTECQEWQEEELIPETTGVWVYTDICLVIYQDDPGKHWNKDYASAKTNGVANAETFEANGKNSIVNKLRQLAANCKRVKCLIFAVHGSPGSMRIGPKNTPYNSATRVGQHDQQTSADDFGSAIASYLAPDAAITLLSCSTADDGGDDDNDGQQFIQDLADATDATVTASDEEVSIDDGDASTDGSVYTATPGDDAPAESVEAPAGDIDTCDC